jgi:hypothetical protein
MAASFRNRLGGGGRNAVPIFTVAQNAVRLAQVINEDDGVEFIDLQMQSTNLHSYIFQILHVAVGSGPTPDHATQ